jgi:hypothetical protein
MAGPRREAAAQRPAAAIGAGPQRRILIGQQAGAVWVSFIVSLASFPKNSR